MKGRIHRSNSILPSTYEDYIIDINYQENSNSKSIFKNIFESIINLFSRKPKIIQSEVSPEMKEKLLSYKV